MAAAVKLAFDEAAICVKMNVNQLNILLFIWEQHSDSCIYVNNVIKTNFKMVTINVVEKVRRSMLIPEEKDPQSFMETCQEFNNTLELINKICYHISKITLKQGRAGS